MATRKPGTTPPTLPPSDRPTARSTAPARTATRTKVQRASRSTSRARPQPAGAPSRRDVWEWRVTLAGGVLLALFLAGVGISGIVSSWQVAMAFWTSGGTVVQWDEGADLVVLLAPFLGVGAARLLLPARWRGRPLLFYGLTLLAIVLAGVLLGKGNALLLEQVARVHSYRHCDRLDRWDPHGSRSGGPALLSWGYSRGGCG